MGVALIACYPSAIPDQERLQAQATAAIEAAQNEAASIAEAAQSEATSTAEQAQAEATTVAQGAADDAAAAIADAQKEATAVVQDAKEQAKAVIEEAQQAAESMAAAPAPGGAATGDAAAKAVDLIGAWVEAGAPEIVPFEYTGRDGGTYQGTYEADIQPLFTENGVWFEGQQACSGCHFGNNENSYHEMKLGTYEGLMTGADALSKPPGVPILGQSEVGATDFDWGGSKLRARLRNNRMPPGWDFDVTETNRDGPCVEVSGDGASVVKYEYGCDLNAVGLLGAWVEAGAPETDSFEYGGQSLTFERDVQPFFTENGMWYEGSQACTGCHFANNENSYHEMDLSSYEGIMTGADSLSKPPGAPILGQSEVGATDFNWDSSKLRARLRNNRMAPGVEFDITEENRDGPTIVGGKVVK